MSYDRLTQESPVDTNITRLAQAFPSVVREGKVDFDALRQLLGDDIGEQKELFGLNWKGKSEARRAALAPSLGTLRPCPEESVDWDSTKNLYIEGDNLEVLKLLRKSYSGCFDVIFIDPPYNTKEDFIYSDDYALPLKKYIEYTEQEGLLKCEQERNGKEHTIWLNMMYPRCLLARDLLKKDGVILITLSDKENHHLRTCLNEIFGEENFITEFFWEKKKKPSFLHKNVCKIFDYVLCYAKNASETSAFSLDKTTPGKKYPFNNRGNSLGILRFPPNSVRFGVESDIIRPMDMSSSDGIITKLKTEVRISNFTNVNEFELEGEWRYSQEKLDSLIKNGDEITISKIPFRPNLVMKGGKTKKMNNVLTRGTTHTETNEDATQQIRGLFSFDAFDTPKPIGLVIQLLKSVKGHNRKISVLDFFSGSATTAHAVMQMNAEDGGNRRFIMVQLPEPCKANTPAGQAGYKNICEIGKERIRRAGKKLKEEAGLTGQGLDTGFRVYKLDSSNVKPWDPDAEDLGASLDLFSEHLVEGRTSDDLLTEVMLKSGIDLCEETETREIAGHRVYSLGYGQFYACMDLDLSGAEGELALGIAAWHAEECAAVGGEQQDTCTVFVADEAFAGRDDAKMNFVSTLQQYGICNVKAL